MQPKNKKKKKTKVNIMQRQRFRSVVLIDGEKMFLNAFGAIEN